MKKREIVIETPQFYRESSEPTPSVPDDFEALREMSAQALREIGCRKWCDPNDSDWSRQGETLWLFPGEWFAHIPIGYEVVDICGKSHKFHPDECDDDIRGGMLAFGIVK